MHSKIKELQLRANPINYSTTSVDAKGNVTEDGRVKGYLAVWGVKDDYGTVMLKGCCSKSLTDRGPQSNAKYKITFLWQHDQKDPLCVFDVLQEDDYGLYFEAMPDDVPSGIRTIKQIRSKTLNQFSVGFNYVWDKVEYDEATDALLLKEIDLFEGSVVTIGSNTETYAVRSAEDYLAQKEQLHEETEEFIKGLPRGKQIELRQLLTRNISLVKFEPHEAKLDALRTKEPIEGAIDYTFLINGLKSTQ